MEKGHKINVLDHGYVTLIDYMGTDESIIEAARMSTGRGFEGWEDRTECERCGITLGTVHSDNGRTTCAQSNPSSDDKSHAWKKKAGDKNLLDFLWRNKHATPFEMCELHIEVQAPIVVLREWHRHRTQSYNEFSARYSKMNDLHYVPQLTRFDRVKSTNKQETSSGKADHREASGATSESMRDKIVQEQHDLYANYTFMLDCDVPKEVARLNTPVSRYSKMRAKTDLRNWLAFLNLRMRPNAQLEIRQYANAVAEIIKELWPRSYTLFEEYDLYGVTLSRKEITALRNAMYADGDNDWVDRELNRQAVDLQMGQSLTTEFMRKFERGGNETL